MMTYWNVLIISGLIGGVAGGLSVLLFGLLMPKKRCPNCGTPFPRFRKPTFNRQTFWGGATCEKCGCEVNRYGRAIKTP
jgi:hypothetical protein